jgi:hypothetical protein
VCVQSTSLLCLVGRGRLSSPLFLVLFFLWLSLASAGRSLVEQRCLSHPHWKDLLHNYSSLYASSLDRFAGGDARGGEGARVRFTVAVIEPRSSRIGLGDVLPGLSNIFLSALRHDRIFWLDWELALGSVLEPGSGLNAFHLPANASHGSWRQLVDKLGPSATFIHGGPPELAGDTAPLTPWSVDAVSADVAVFKEFNRGVYTRYGATHPDDTAWLERTVPRGPDGALAFGCVYAAALRFSPTFLHYVTRLKEKTFRPSKGRVMCVHLRLGDTALVKHVRPANTSPQFQRATACLDRVLDARRETAVFVAADDASAVRMLGDHVRARNHTFISSQLKVAHVANWREQKEQSHWYRAVPLLRHAPWLRFESITDQEIINAYTSSWAEWLLLSSCHVLLLSSSGFSRTAAAYGSVVSADGEPSLQTLYNFGANCTALRGPHRDAQCSEGAGC